MDPAAIRSRSHRRAAKAWAAMSRRHGRATQAAGRRLVEETRPDGGTVRAGTADPGRRAPHSSAGRSALRFGRHLLTWGARRRGASASRCLAPARKLVAHVWPASRGKRDSVGIMLIASLAANSPRGWALSASASPRRSRARSCGEAHRRCARGPAGHRRAKATAGQTGHIRTRTRQRDTPRRSVQTGPQGGAGSPRGRTRRVVSLRRGPLTVVDHAVQTRRRRRCPEGAMARALARCLGDHVALNRTQLPRRNTRGDGVSVHRRRTVHRRRPAPRTAVVVCVGHRVWGASRRPGRCSSGRSERLGQ
jgi:hypothetical protein